MRPLNSIVLVQYLNWERKPADAKICCDDDKMIWRTQMWKWAEIAPDHRSDPDLPCHKKNNRDRHVMWFGTETLNGLLKSEAGGDIPYFSLWVSWFHLNISTRRIGILPKPLTRLSWINVIARDNVVRRHGWRVMYQGHRFRQKWKCWNCRWSPIIWKYDLFWGGFVLLCLENLFETLHERLAFHYFGFDPYVSFFALFRIV